MALHFFTAKFVSLNNYYDMLILNFSFDNMNDNSKYLKYLETKILYIDISGL